MDKSPKLLADERVRQAFPILKEVTYFNTGTYGLMPEPALVEFQTVQAEFERAGVASKGDCFIKTEETRKRLAALIGADGEEITLTRNATDGINLVLAGLDWQPGDEVITTDEEHEAIAHPLLYLQRTKGLRVKWLKTSPQAEIMLERLEEAFNDRTRLIILSYVTCETGTRLPAQEISRWATEHNILCLFDGAQASGAFPVDVRALGLDFYTSNGHKWLCGPKGTGFFYSRKERLAALSPAHVGAGSLERADIASGLAEPFLTGQRFEFGTRAWGLSAGLGASLDWFEGLGWENVYGHIATLSDYFKERILERRYLKLITPRAFETSSGLTSFVVEGNEAGKISTVLREQWRIYVRVVPHYNAIRISTAHFNNREDVDRLMEALAQTCGRN